MKEHPVFARFYERLSLWMDEAGERENRIELVGEARGRVLEVGSGNGLNFEHYRVASGVVAMEPDATMLRMAAPRVRAAGAPVVFVRGVAERLPFQDGSFDTVVASLVLCTVRAPSRAARELARVLRPGGEVRFLEHVRSTSRAWAGVQDAVEPVWSFFAGGCHPNRDTLSTLRAAGFSVESRRFPFGPPSPARPHTLGVARRG
jgi:ubiquinone/menaquinone biosynthesis C-methylase UbiE